MSEKRHISNCACLDCKSERDGIDRLRTMYRGSDELESLRSRLALAEKVVGAARGANSHWNEFGPEYDLDRQMDALHKALTAYDEAGK